MRGLKNWNELQELMSKRFVNQGYPAIFGVQMSFTATVD